MMLHAFIAIVVPNFHFDTPKPKPKELTIELLKPEPAPVVAPEPIVPETPPPPPKPKPKPVKKKPKPKPLPKPKPIVEPEPVEEPVQQEVLEAPPPAVIAAAPVAEAEPTFVVPEPTPQPPPPPQISQADIDNARSRYRSMLGNRIAKFKSYPKMAQRRGWQGVAIVNLKLDDKGHVISAIIKESSGHNALDKSALKMVKKASPFPAPPVELNANIISIDVPVAFKLTNG